MSGEAIIRARLLASVELGALVEPAAIFAGRAAQNQRPPFVVWRRIGGATEHTLDGPTSLKSGRFQIDCYGETYDQALALAGAVIPAIEGTNDGDLHAELTMELDLYEEDPPAKWRRVLDFMVMERTD